MRKQTILRFASVVPILALNLNLSFADISTRIADFHSDERIETMIIWEERAEAIDRYFKARNMPLEGMGMKMVIEAKKNDIDWRLLPAIAIRESTGGKFACKTAGYNSFGWGSCKIGFDSNEEAIETVARNLGGNEPKTEHHYAGKNTKQILQKYNPPSVVLKYAEQVMSIMENIGTKNLGEVDIVANT